ncbi:hypothetical protein MJH12_15785, partial [bacterium]|nr:hypothetical protein [bacterium]
HYIQNLKSEVPCQGLTLIALWNGISLLRFPASAKRVVMDWQVYKIPKLLNILFILLLPVFQPQQAKRFEVIRLFKQGQYKEAIQFLQEAKVSDFPRYWTPPPKWRYRKNDLDMLKILEILQSSEKDSWVKDSYYGQIDAYLRYTYRFRKIEDCSRAHRYYKVMQKIKDAEKFKYLMKRIQDECFDNSDQNSESKIIN